MHLRVFCVCFHTALQGRLSEGCPNRYALTQLLPSLEVIFSKSVSLKGWHASSEHWCSNATGIKIFSQLKTTRDTLIRIVQWWLSRSKSHSPLYEKFVFANVFLELVSTYILKTQQWLKLTRVFICVKGRGKWELPQCCMQGLKAVLLYTVVV